jgi:hypothetical protein
LFVKKKASIHARFFSIVSFVSGFKI